MDASSLRHRCRATGDKVGIDDEIPLPSLACGTPGIAVFFAERGENPSALEYVDRAIAKAAEDMPRLPLYAGTPGIGWMLAYLERSVLDPD